MDMRYKTYHKNDGSTFYTTCRCNCGGNFQCVIKANVKDGKVLRVEPDDRYNNNIGREDAFLNEEDLYKVRLQRRPCVMGLAFHKYAQLPERILYPLKRKAGSQRGDGQYERISWEEALDAICAKMRECREKYGPLSIISPYMPNNTMERLFSFWGAGAEGWGWCSYDSARLMAQFITGERGWALDRWSSGSAMDMLAHSKSIVLWGCDPTVGHMGPAHMFAWYIKMAREKGVPVIIIDPRFSTAVRTCADQWIPIKPGTDVAMMMAIAYVMFQDDTWDKAFVAEFVEPEGFQKFQDYVLGHGEDGIPKTPAWAARKCAVPAETIEALARFIWTNSPCWTWAHWTLSRKSHGNQVITTFAALQSMLGNWGKPGGGPSIHPGPQREIPVGLFSTFWGPNGAYKVPKLFRAHYWAQAVMLLDEYKAGRISRAEYISRTGWRADKALVDQFNPKFLFWGGGSKPHASNYLVTACDSANDQVKVLQRMEFVISMQSVMTASARYADIILPAQDWIWEQKDIIRSSPYGCFEGVHANPKVVEPPGEVRHWTWVYIEIAKRLGVNPKQFFKYYDEHKPWEEIWESYLKDVYAGLEDYYDKQNKTIPTYDAFMKGNFLNCDELDDKIYTGWDEQIKDKKPFKTTSGKIELYYKLFEDESRRGQSEHYDSNGNVFDNLAADWNDMTASPTYMTGRRSMDDPMTREYPLQMMSSHCRYRVHYVHWANPWLRNHVYRHRVWLNPADAQTRGIQDNDLVLVYNDRGKVAMPAYVTPRTMPGITLIHHGGDYLPDANGIDRGACVNTLMGGDDQSDFTPARSVNLVQIAKYMKDE